jgi:hypothetical protein
MQQCLRITVRWIKSLLICDSNSRTGSNFLPTLMLGEAKRLLLTRIVCYRETRRVTALRVEISRGLIYRFTAKLAELVGRQSVPSGTEVHYVSRDSFVRGRICSARYAAGRAAIHSGVRRHPITGTMVFLRYAHALAVHNRSP